MKSPSISNEFDRPVMVAPVSGVDKAFYMTAGLAAA